MRDRGQDVICYDDNGPNAGVDHGGVRGIGGCGADGEGDEDGDERVEDGTVENPGEEVYCEVGVPWFLIVDFQAHSGRLGREEEDLEGS